MEEDMLSSYLDLKYDAPSEGEVLLVVTRHEDGSWVGPKSEDYQRQRKDLIVDLAKMDGVKVPRWEDVNDKNPHETIQAIIDIVGIVIPSTATVLCAWIAARPRNDKNTVPGFVMIGRGRKPRLKIDHRIPESEREKQLQDWLEYQKRRRESGRGGS